MTVLTFYEKYAQQRAQAMGSLENRYQHVRIRSETEQTHTIIPAQSPTRHCLLTSGSCRALNASCRRCTNAVERMTPVPKCFPMKKRILGTRIERNVEVTVGNETANGRRS